VDSFIIAAVVAVLCCFGAAWLGAAGKMRALTRRVLDCEYSIEDLEGRVVREVKIRAGEMGRKQKTQDQAMLNWAEEQAALPADPASTAHQDFKTERWNKMKGKG